MLVSLDSQWSKLMQEESVEIELKKRRLQAFQRSEAAFFPQARSINSPGGSIASESARATGPGDRLSLTGKAMGSEGASKRTSIMGTTKDVVDLSGSRKKRTCTREEQEVEDLARSLKKRREAISAAVDHHRGLASSESPRPSLSGVWGHPTMGTFDSQVLPLQFSHPSQERSDLALGFSAARNAAMLASLNQSHSHLDPYLMASSRLAGGNSSSWNLGSRYPGTTQGLFSSHGTSTVTNSPFQFAEQERAALLRLNALQGNQLILEGSSRVNASLNNAFYRSSLPGSLLRHTQASGDSLSSSLLGNFCGPVSGAELSGSSMGMGSRMPGISDSRRDTLHQSSLGGSGGQSSSPLSLLPPPQNEDGAVPHFHQRPNVPLATDEDQNWLSEFLCFVRLELVEIFRANQEDVRSRNSSKKVSHGQVGIRCRFCAHMPLSSRASRSSSYPSSLSRIYQSLTMMLRDHFGKCSAIPLPLKQRFLELKGKTSQGATDSKHYWVYSAMKRGLLDSQSGIWVREGGSQAAPTDVPPFGATGAAQAVEPRAPAALPQTMTLVTPEDRPLVSEFLYALMTQVQRVNMEESERTGNRKSLAVGLPGIGCRHCCQSNRKGLCRLFPVRRRTLPNKINDLYEHIRRCTLCPAELKEHLAILRQRDGAKEKSAGEKECFDRIWARMGHGADHIES